MKQHFWHFNHGDQIATPSSIDRRREIACPRNPIVILTGGQSNAGNYVGPRIEERPEIDAYMMFDGRCFRLSDPLFGATGTQGSIWSALGHRIAEFSQRPVLFINGAVADSSIRDWIHPRSVHFSRLRSQVNAAAERGVRPTIVLWHQGETDARRAVGAETFFLELEELSRRLLQELQVSPKTQIVFYRASVCAPLRPNPNYSLLRAQTAIGLGRQSVLGPNTDAYGSEFRVDGCHFNERGRDAIVQATLNVLSYMLSTE